MDNDIKPDEAEGAREILERIRARLKQQIRRDYASGSPALPERGDEQVSAARLRTLLNEIRSTHRSVGGLNPRPSGLFNDLIQLLKKALRRMLGWYTRPIVQHQAATIQFLGAVADILERNQSRLESLEAHVERLAEDLAEMRQRTLGRLERIDQELPKRDR